MTLRYLHDCFSPDWLYWIGALKSNPITPFSFSHETPISLFAPCLKATILGQGICSFSCPIWLCIGKAGESLTWQTLSSAQKNHLPSLSTHSGYECLCPNVGTAGGPQGQSPWLRPSHTQGVDTPTETSSVADGENCSPLCRSVNTAVISIPICPFLRE